jgi:hypothetical protein
LVGEVCDADAVEPAVGSEPGGGSLPEAPAVADALALFDCPTACPFVLPLPTPTETFPLLGELWSDVAPAWALWVFELGAPFAWSADEPELPPEFPGGWPPLPVPLALVFAVALPLPFAVALPVPLAFPLAVVLPVPVPFWFSAGCRAPAAVALGSAVTELAPDWLPEGVVGWLSAKAAGAVTSKTSAAADAARTAVPAFVALLRRPLTAQTV